MATFGPNRLNPHRRSQGNNAWRVVRTATYNFVAFENDTVIYRNGESLVTINAGGNSSQTLNAGDIIYSNKYISMHESGSGNTAMYAAWHGTRFAHRRDRYNVTVYFWHIWPGPQETLTIDISRDGTAIGSVNLPAGGSGWGSYNIGTITGNYIFESTNNRRFACIAGEFPSSDVMPLYPCDYKDAGPYELYGTASSGGDVIALDNSTTITEYTSAGGVRTFTLNRGQSTGISAGGSQFAGNSTRLVADKPIYASSQADADGGEMTPYVSPEAFGTHASVPTTRNQFVKLVSNQPAVVNVNGTNRTLTGTNGIYQYYQTAGAPQGAILTSTTPFCAVYESDAEDETILSMWSQENVSYAGFGPRATSEGLILALDAANPASYPGSGNIWYDISGQNNHFTLFNNPTWFEAEKYFLFTAASQYASSTNTINLSGLSAVTVECAYRVDTVNDNKMIFEHTINWNNQAGAFGAFTNSNGGLDTPSTYNDLHMNSAVGRLDSGPIGDITQFGISQWTYVSGSGITHYHNNVRPTVISNTIGTGTFSNDRTYIASRGGTSFYDGNLRLAYLKIYNRQLSTEELQQNYIALKGRFGL